MKAQAAAPSLPAAASLGPDAFARDLLALQPTMMLMAQRYTHNRVRAEDLVHDTVVRALRFAHTFVPGSNLRAWVATIMANTFINGYRRLRRERQILEGASREDVATYLRSDAARKAASGPERILSHTLLSDTVHKALAAMPQEYRDVVVLCDLMDQTYRDAASVLGCPLGTIMSRLHRGRRLLKTELGAEALAQGIIRAA